VGEKFLDITLIFLGYIPKDASIPRAVRSQQAVVEKEPDSPAALAFVEVARRLKRLPLQRGRGGLSYFWRQLGDGGSRE
jgi:flagellar biosynthesis protein FlhG